MTKDNELRALLHEAQKEVSGKVHCILQEALALLPAPAADAGEVVRVVEEARTTAIEEIAAKYHDELADFYSNLACEKILAGFPGFADEHRDIATRHRTYAREIRAQVWLSDATPPTTGDAGQGEGV